MGRPTKKVVRERYRRILLDLIVGLCLTLALMILGRLFETTVPGQLIEDALYCWAQTRLLTAESRLPVAVVDFGRLSPDKEVQGLSPREQLTALVKKIAAMKPAAIGIDLDFSPCIEVNEQVGCLEKGWTPRGGPQFFEDISSLGVPTYLGVSRSRYMPASSWLGAEEYRGLAAAILLRTDGNREIPLWLALGEDSCKRLSQELFQHQSSSETVLPSTQRGATDCLPTLSAALARNYSDRHQFSTVTGHFLRVFHQERIRTVPGFYAAYFSPNYSVTQLIHDQTSTAILIDHGVDLVLNPALTGDLAGRVVLIGNTDWTASDKYPIPPWQKTTQGVYFHADAAYTLVEGPLWELTSIARAGLDLILSVVILGTVAWLRLHYAERSRPVAHHYLHRVLTAIAFFSLLVFGYGFVRYTHILWTDSLLLGVVLVCHSLFGPSLENTVATAWKNFRMRWEDFVLRESKEDL